MLDLENLLTPEEEAFVARLADAIQRAGGPAKVAAREDVPAKTVYNWRSGKNASTAIALARIAKACGRSIDSFFRPQNSPNEEGAPPDLAEVVDVPILDAIVAAGAGGENGEPAIRARMPFPRTILRRMGIVPEKVRGLRAGGDSMWPTIGDGQLVLIDTGATELRDGKIYVLYAPDGLRLKRIQRHQDGGIVLISDNKELYQPELIRPPDTAYVRVVGRAFWTERLL